ncbi:sensor domain-containing diguanylate cyclase [Mesorhizobium sp. CAU 1741]|uniref:GGDEF domain-containing protein n=1 Tax=Mesorhizobium sp. CAU 1741 TaxID=3140366 RepID=UPI00325AB903
MSTIFASLAAFAVVVFTVFAAWRRYRALAVRIESLETQAGWYHDALRIAGAGVWNWHIQDDQWNWVEDTRRPRGSTLSYPVAMSDDFHTFLHPDDRERYLAIEDACRMGQESYVVDYRYMLAEGETRWLRDIAHRSADNGSGSPVMVGITLDITEEKLRALDSERQSGEDELTGLPNRRSLLDHLAQRVGAGLPLALAFIDLNGFKTLNDRHGHASGDMCLGLLGRNLTARLAKGEFAARLGGDEFVIIVQGDDEDAAIARVEDLVSDALLVANAAVKARVGAAIGMAFFPRQASTSQELLSAADQAMYLAKATGRPIEIRTLDGESPNGRRRSA